MKTTGVVSAILFLTFKLRRLTCARIDLALKQFSATMLITIVICNLIQDKWCFRDRV